MRELVLTLVLIVAVLIGCTPTPAAPPVAEPKPTLTAAQPQPGKPRVKLAVLVVFDQLRGDYLEKWKPLFGKDGFTRLLTDGAWFTDCHYPYATTTTGPGHAAMLTGTCPDRHGIVNNDWSERGRA